MHLSTTISVIILTTGFFANTLSILRGASWDSIYPQLINPGNGNNTPKSPKVGDAITIRPEIERIEDDSDEWYPHDPTPWNPDWENKRYPPMEIPEHLPQVLPMFSEKGHYPVCGASAACFHRQ
jgi:hypothetical protein